MESMPVNWEALDALVVEFARSERLLDESSSDPSSSSYESRLLIRQIGRCLETGDVDQAISLLRRHVPKVLDDHRILFRLQKQKFIELLRKGTVRERDAAIECLRNGLAPCALDAYPEAYEEFKHVLLALIYDKEDKASPVVNEWSERRRFDLAGLLSSILRAELHVYDPIFAMTLRYLISIHKVFCLRGVSSPISDFTQRLLSEDRDPPVISPESFCEAPQFDEVDVQALAHAVELTRQGAVDSLRFAKGDIILAFQNELCRMKLDVLMLDELVREYCIYRGIVDGVPVSPSDLASSSSTDRTSDKKSGTTNACNIECSVENVPVEGAQEGNATSIRSRDVEIRFANETSNNHEDCSTSDTSQPETCCRRLRRSRNDATGQRRRKRWRGRVDWLELKSDANCIEVDKQDPVLALDANGDSLGRKQVFKSISSLDKVKNIEDHRYEFILEMMDLANKGMVAEVVEEVNALDPEFFSQNPSLLFQLKQVEFLKMVNVGNHAMALRVASSHLGPLAASNQALLKPLKETLLALLKPNEEAVMKGLPILATSLQVAMSRRLGIEEPQLMRIMRTTLHTHDEWFKLQMCKDRFAEFLKIDTLKEVDPHINSDTTSKICTGDNIKGSQVTSISSKVVEDGSSPSQVSSTETAFDENAIVKVMEFLALPRSDAIQLLAQYDGNPETVILHIFS